MKKAISFYILIICVVSAIIAGATSITVLGAEVPKITSLIFYGGVQMAGGDSADGYKLTARIGDYESQPVVIGGDGPSGRYYGLFVNPPAGENVGDAIEFWLEGQIIANETEIFLYLNPGGSFDTAWSLPQQREFDLSFSSKPVATPTPTPTPTLTPTPTATPVVLKPSFYEGRAIAQSQPVKDGIEIYAKVGDYVSDSAIVLDGNYFLTVDPADKKYFNVNVEFYIANIKAIQSESFTSDLYRADFLLVFPSVPESTPVPTNTPTPSPVPTTAPTATLVPTKVPSTSTPTPEPLRTATPTVIPTSTVTPTATPTAVVNLGATIVAQNKKMDEMEESGGFCSANSDGTASLGIIGLLFIPLLLIGRNKMGYWLRKNS